MTTFIPLSVPTLNGREARYINDCLETGWVSSAGRYVEEFGRRCAEVAGTRFAVPVVNGTAALHLATKVAGIRRDEEVVVPDLTFIGTVAGVYHAGAFAAILDVDPQTWQLDPHAVDRFLRVSCQKRKDGVFNKESGRRVGAIMPVHLLGHPVDMDPILALAEEFDLVVIEDAAEAVGARYKNRLVGGIGSLGCFSFNGNKTFTCGGGGAIVTNDALLAERALYFSTQAKDDPVLFVHNEIGYNYRLTNLQAAMGVGQLETVDDYLQRKREIRSRYRDGLAGLPGVKFPKSANWAVDAMWLTAILIEPQSAACSNLQLMKALKDGDHSRPSIETRMLWQPMHRNKALDGSWRGSVEHAEEIYAQALCLPSSVGLTVRQQDIVIDTIRSLLA